MGRKSKSITQKKLEVLSARVDYDLYKRVEALALRQDLSVTQVIRKAISEFLENHKRAA